MTTPRGTPPATALWSARGRASSLPSSYTTTGDTTQRFGLAHAQRDAQTSTQRLWRCRRETAWRHVKAVMAEAGISGRRACPRGLRHGFGVGTLQAGVPVMLLQKWMGHTKVATTAIYADISGPEERGFADSYQRWSEALAA